MSWEEFNKLPHTIIGAVEKWAEKTPDKIALIMYDTGVEITYKELSISATAFALKLYNMGFRKGDIIATSLPFIQEHIILGYACAKLGVMWTPFDLRLKPLEISRCLDLLKDKCKMYCHLGKTTVANFGMIGAAVRKQVPWLEQVVQFSTPEDRYRKGIIPAYKIAEEAKEEYKEAMQNPDSMKDFEAECAKVGEEDSVLIIFTTGSTGFPKPAMLTNKGIICQDYIITNAGKVDEDTRMLCNLPPSHVGGNTEQLMAPLLVGATVVMLHIFDAEKSLDAIQKHKATILGQIPALFNMEWRLPNYDEYDLSSLKHAIYSGQAADRPFIEKLATMGHPMTGYGLTEVCGFCTITTADDPIEDVFTNVGKIFPITPVTIRKPKNEDGTAGDILADGEIGEVCVGGPQVFKGYFGNEKATNETLSTDRILYTGDLGYVKENKLYLSGRRKFLLKPKGYQVFPPEVEAFIADLPQVEFVGIIGAKHAVFSDGLVAYIKVKEGQTLNEEEVVEHCKGMAAYKRPSLIIFIEGEFPLNRVAKTDYLILQERVEKDVEEARAQGGWDS